MKKLKTYTIIFLLNFISGCGFFESTSDVIIGEYNISFVDDVTWRSIYSDNGILIEPYVFAVGHNDNFIIAKQHPCERNEFKVITSITKYFIIDITKSDSRGGGIYKANTKQEFDSLSKSLNIGIIKFDMNYPEQPHVFAR